MKKFDSRGPDLDMEKTVAMAGGNRFQLIIEASARARQIRRQNQNSDRHEHLHPCITALTEIQEGKFKK